MHFLGKGELNQQQSVDEEKEVRRTVGLRIRELRKSLGLTAVTLCAQTGMSQSQLSKIENGKAAISIAALTRTCRVLDRPLSYLFQKEEEIPRVLGTMTTVGGPESRGIEWFAKEVSRRSGGSMSLIPLRATILGSAPSQVEMLRQGVIDVFIEELIYYHLFSEAVKVASLPYAFSSGAHLMNYLQSQFFEKKVRQPLLENKIKILNQRWNWRRGLERVLVCKTPITHPGEIKGLRVRIFAPILARFWEELGAKPIVVPWVQVKSAWEKGEFDLLPTHKAHLYPLGFCPKGRFVTLLGDVPPAMAVAVNENKYTALPPSMQDHLNQACDAAGDYFTELVRQAERENEAANMAEHGAVYMTVDLTPWKKEARRAIDKLVRTGQLAPEVWQAVRQVDPEL
jgi:TRAP-type C4-dicarboxylate transport system substrate-binding protein